MLQFLRVSKKYGDKLILSIPELTVSNGIYWLQGANGSGKTTLLKILAGLIPFDGEIKLDGMGLIRRPTDYRTLVSSTEAEPVYPGFVSGRELIGFYQHIRKAQPSQVNRLIDRLGFGQFIAAPVSTYSSGMLKRLSLLLAFIGEPKLILLDEPLSTLDADAVAILPQIMMERHTETGTGFIFSSHASFSGDRLIVDQRLMLIEKTIHLNA